MLQQNQKLEFSSEVADAIAQGRPVVALESTVVTHGLPREPREMSVKFHEAVPEWPRDVSANLAAARTMESVVRAEGAVPATIAIIDGSVCVGLSAKQLERLAGETNPKKVSARDLGVSVAQRQTGGTTVAATTTIAACAGIRVFATGGIGGVHRGWNISMDVSSDLVALARSPVVVVCAGAKVLLDLPATLEGLETLGIPTIGFETEFLPRFTAEPDRSLRLHHTAESASEVARIAHAHWQLQPTSGVLVMQPCPAAFAVDAESTERQLARVLELASAKNVRGAALTPFLLAQLAQGEEGPRMVEANLALLKANARLAARVAAGICSLSFGSHSP